MGGGASKAPAQPAGSPTSEASPKYADARTASTGSQEPGATPSSAPGKGFEAAFPARSAPSAQAADDESKDEATSLESTRKQSRILRRPSIQPLETNPDGRLSMHVLEMRMREIVHDPGAALFPFRFPRHARPRSLTLARLAV